MAVTVDITPEVIAFDSGRFYQLQYVNTAIAGDDSGSLMTARMYIPNGLVRRQAILMFPYVRVEADGITNRGADFYIAGADQMSVDYVAGLALDDQGAPPGDGGQWAFPWAVQVKPGGDTRMVVQMSNQDSITYAVWCAAWLVPVEQFVEGFRRMGAAYLGGAGNLSHP